MAESVGHSNRKQFLGISEGSWGLQGDNERTRSGREGLVGGRVSSRLTNALLEVRKVGESCFLRKEQVNLTDFCCGVTSRSNSES